MKTAMALLSAVLISLPGCVVHPHHHPRSHAHGHGKRMYRCGHCGGTSSSAVSCHGKLMIVID